MSGFELPAAPAGETGAVKAWAQDVVIPTYLPGKAEKNPMFLERRVYQGSSGRVYPLPFVDRIGEERMDRAWEAVHLENEFVRVMILPELGGRIHVGLDKTNGYDFFYRQNSIKPALVGLAGPWISGGVEFNWPQHHRPSTFMPTEWTIERHADGSVTVWCSEHEPMNRMKGMHGVCLHPGRSVIELKVRLHNRTELPQTFLWWANVAVRVHERYQSFFPPDVRYVADHAKRAMSAFPLCEGKYYGVDYGELARQENEQGLMSNDRWGDGTRKRFVPPVVGGKRLYAANDLSWYANIPVPTSYMAMGSKEDFFGGYDHAVAGGGAGLVHVADHHIAPGKKQWTWGNHEFGYAWDRNLADDEAPYIELMAGVFTDNQPDFSWLMPGETRAWSQYWYPIQKVGPVQKANVEGAIALKVEGRRARVGVCATAVLNGARVVVKTRGEVVKELTVDLGPGRPWVGEVDVGEAVAETEVRVAVRDAEGREVVAYQPAPRTQAEVPAAAKEPSLPAEVESVEELYLIGVHLEQYRHATRMPEAYWREALKRDPGESRCHTALGWWHLRRGEFEKAVGHFERAIESLTKFNPNPREGEALYGLGIALRYLGRLDEAYGSLAKAAWNGAWASAAHLVMGQITCRKKEWGKALGHAEESCKMNWEYLQGRLLHALAVRESKTPYGRRLYEQEVEGLERMDLLNAVPRLVRGDGGRADVQTRLDTALELAKMGLWSDALRVLEGAESDAGVEPMVHYYRGYFHEQMGDLEAAGRERGAGKRASSDYCFPVRLEEIDILLSAIAADATDGRAMCYLGNLLYDKKRREEAITWWEKSVRAEAGFSIPWRNLGIAYYNVHRDAAAARGAYERALQAEPGAPRLLYERDQLWKRTGETPSRRLEVLSEHLERVMSRDDLTIEWCALLNQTGQHEAALDVLKHRKFQPWEGGEGMVLAQWVRAHVGLGRKVLLKGEAAGALAIFEAGVGVPTNLGEARHLLANYSELDYWRGVAARKAGDEAGGRKHLERAAAAVGDFRDMAVCAFSEATYFSGRALMELGRVAEARKLFEGMLGYARELAKMPAKIDYFATSLPTMLLFEEDLQARQRMQAALVEALARHGLGEKKAGRQMLQDLVREWPSQSVAADLLEWVELA